MPRSFAEKHRAWIVVIIVLPISLILHIIGKLRRLLSACNPKDHVTRVQRVAMAVAGNAAAATTTDVPLLRTDRCVYESHSVRNSDKSQSRQIELRDLRANIGLSSDNTAENLAVLHVEPGATVGEVTTFLLQQTPPLQLEATLEMEDATLGGLAMAQGMTTHSHVCGLLAETITEYEIVTASGNVVLATADNTHAELFRALPLSHGSLGFLVSLKLRVVPAKPWVRLEYRPFASATALHAAYTDVLAQAMREDKDTPFFVEAIVYSEDTAVLMTGHLADEVAPDGGSVNRIGWYYKPWFYKHVESKLALLAGGSGVGPAADTEYIPIRDYLMRHDRSMCMTMGTIIPFGNQLWARLLFGWLLPPRMSFLKASHTAETRAASARLQCYQDVCFPAAELPAALGLCRRAFGIYPLLLYPCMLHDRAGMLKVPVVPEPVPVPVPVPIPREQPASSAAAAAATPTPTATPTPAAAAAPTSTATSTATSTSASTATSAATSASPSTSAGGTGRRVMCLNLGVYGVPPELQRMLEADNGGGGGGCGSGEGAASASASASAGAGAGASAHTGSGAGAVVYPMVTKVRQLERWLRDVGGFQHTYCDSFQTEEEFERMYDHGLYRRMRARYGAQGTFPTVYEKTRPEMDVFEWLKEEGKAL